MDEVIIVRIDEETKALLDLIKKGKFRYEVLADSTGNTVKPNGEFKRQKAFAHRKVGYKMGRNAKLTMTEKKVNWGGDKMKTDVELISAVMRALPKEAGNVITRDKLVSSAVKIAAANKLGRTHGHLTRSVSSMCEKGQLREVQL